MGGEKAEALARGFSWVCPCQRPWPLLASSPTAPQTAGPISKSPPLRSTQTSQKYFHVTKTHLNPPQKMNKWVKKSRNQPLQPFLAHLVLIYKVTLNSVAQARSLALAFHIQLAIQAWPGRSPAPGQREPPHGFLQDQPNSLPLSPCFGLSCCQSLLLSASMVAALETKREVPPLLKDHPWPTSV